MKSSFLLVISIGFYTCLCGFTYMQESTEWKVPKEYLNLENPTDITDSENQAIGKSLYSKYCKSCHGKEGYGDGPEAEEQKGELGDFSSGEFQNQTDGSLFYKITKGRDDMPNFNKKISSTEDRWLVVNHLRSLKE